MGTARGDISMVDMARVWPILCQFGVGGLLGLIGIWAGISGGYLNISLKDDRKLLAILIGGFLALLALYCAFTFWLPFVGGAEASA